MSETLPSTTPDPAPGDLLIPDDVIEAVARRALGAALSQMWASAASGIEQPVPDCDPEVARRAIALLHERVPAGPELELATRLLGETQRSRDSMPQ